VTQDTASQAEAREVLAKCPFCGNDGGPDDASIGLIAVQVRSYEAVSGLTAFNVECGCGAKGSPSYDRAKAVRHWNDRSPLAFSARSADDGAGEIDAESEAEIAHAEKTRIIAWLRHQSDLGANIGVEAEKGSTRRAAFGGGSLALKRAADAIEADDHISNDNPAARPAVSREAVIAAVKSYREERRMWPFTEDMIADVFFRLLQKQGERA
jgi:hypothetical protein